MSEATKPPQSPTPPPVPARLESISGAAMGDDSGLIELPPVPASALTLEAVAIMRNDDSGLIDLAAVESAGRASGEHAEITIEPGFDAVSAVRVPDPNRKERLGFILAMAGAGFLLLAAAITLTWWALKDPEPKPTRTAASVASTTPVSAVPPSAAPPSAAPPSAAPPSAAPPSAAPPSAAASIANVALESIASAAAPSAAPESTAPESVAPESVASAAPESVAPESVAPESVAPESVASAAAPSIAPPSAAPESVASAAPESAAPESVAPESVASAAPPSAAPEPVAPKSIASAAPVSLAQAGTALTAAKPAPPPKTSPKTPPKKRVKRRKPLPVRLAVSDVRRVVQKSASRVRRCAKHAGGKTQVNVSVLVSRKGRVTQAAATGPHAGTPLGKCVAQQARRLRFPAFSGSPMRIRLPYAF